MASSYSKAYWSDTRHQTFVQLCLEEVKKGNRPTSSFNKMGWANIVEGLFTIENVRYTQKQVKNHFTLTKCKYVAWMKLENETGLGRDPVTGAVTCGNDRWNTFIQKNPDCKEFRYRPIPHLDELREIFGGTHKTREHLWTPSEGTHPSSGNNDEDLRESSEGPRDVYSVIEVAAEDSRDSNGTGGQKEKSTGMHSKSQQFGFRKRKELASEKFDKQLMCGATFKRSNNPPLSTPQPSTTIKDCLTILNDMLNEISDELFVTATFAFKDPDNRDIWMYMAPEKRIVWLKALQPISKN